MRIRLLVVFILLSATCVAEEAAVVQPAPEMMQQMAVPPPEPIQQQLQKRMSEQCIEKLEKYHYEVNMSDPDSLIGKYYRYLLHKWENRCID